MLRFSFWVAVFHVFAIVGHRSSLTGVVIGRDGQDGNIHFVVLLRRGCHCLPITVVCRMQQPFLEDRGRVPDNFIQRVEWPLAEIHLPKLPGPESTLAKERIIGRPAAGQGQPLHDVAFPNSSAVRARVCGCYGNGSRQMRRELLQGRPLIEARIRTSPHGDFAVAPRLPSQEFHDVVAIGRFLCKRVEDALLVATSAHVYQYENVSMLRKIRRPILVTVCDVRREGEDNRQRLLLPSRLKDRAVETDSIAHRNLESPEEIHSGRFAFVGWRRRFFRPCCRRWLCRGDRG